MATQRVTTPAPAKLININPQGQANPATCKIDFGQNVDFSNNSGSTISITFAPTAIHHYKVFDDIPSLASGSNYTELPLVDRITVNYNVSMGGQTYGPFAIEVGTGPLEISVTNINPTPGTGSIPPNGEVLFDSTDVTYDVSWQPQDPFTPPITKVYVGVSNNQVGQENGNLGDFYYTLTTSPQPALSGKQEPVRNGGGGTIKVT